MESFSHYSGTIAFVSSLLIIPVAFALDPVVAVGAVWITLLAAGIALLSTRQPSLHAKLSAPICILSSVFLAHYTASEGLSHPTRESISGLMIVIAPPLLLYVVLMLIGVGRRQA